jgi:hypothetical protein
MFPRNALPCQGCQSDVSDKSRENSLTDILSNHSRLTIRQFPSIARTAIASETALIRSDLRFSDRRLREFHGNVRHPGHSKGPWAIYRWAITLTTRRMQSS